MELKNKKINELNKKYNTSGVCSGVALKGTFAEMIKQLEGKYADTDFLEIEIKKVPNSSQYIGAFFYDDSFSRF
ncbi:hypothetical protein [Granulicatella adiacens]|uniref:hypothetical protein n=1 Tax=Granulicatella adiacens TaxID=46124 RepID=UPI00241FB40F|nr:hypothetical protein [Granulicatella adiacens]